jgi:beta-glucosidase
MKNHKRNKRGIFLSVSAVMMSALMLFMSACGSVTAIAPYIGDDGYWYVNGEKTEYKAQGEKGEQGEQGEPGKDYQPAEVTPEAVDPLTEGLTDVIGSQSAYTDNAGKYYLDYATLADEQEAAKDLAIQIAEEGNVLLKNADQALPLTSAEKRVSLFGTASYALTYSGGGSGAGTLGNNGVAASTLPDSLTSAGLKINPTLTNFYKNYSGKDHEVPIGNYSSPVISTYKGYNDVAIVTLSRVGSEDGDLATHDAAGHSDADDHECMLQDNEKDLIAHVKKYFKKVVVLINSSNIMQIPELAEEKTDSNLGVDAILWIGCPGNNGIMSVGKILNGEVNPSGRTVDLWEADFTQGPVWTNFSEQGQNKDENGNRLDALIYDKAGNDTGYRTVEYREGIYTGYRYYETLYADAAEKDKEEAYSNVLYPFGYGLSYTSFEWELSRDISTDAAITAANQTITIKVKVTNTGDVAGKDVVQIYSNPPYTKGGIEKAAANLLGFAKTDTLNPGQSQTVSVSVNAQDLASFDWNDANGNGFSGYELEAGNYVISANRDSHTPVLSVNRTVGATILCKTDLQTGEEISPVFTGDYTSISPTCEENMISRANGLQQPAAASKEDRTYDDDTLAWLNSQADYEPYQDSEEDAWYVSEVPENWTQASSHQSDYSDMITKLREMVGIRYNDPTVTDGVATSASDADSLKWEEFMNQLTWEDLCDLVSKGGGTLQIDSLDLPSTGYVDGPVQLSGGTLWPSAPVIAATYNVELESERGRMVGNEAIFLNRLGGWAGPAVNLHRSALAGRCFEYYSEDGVVAARMAEACVSAATEKGLICYVKHMLLNEQEKYRNAQGGVLTFASEQVIRELYAKPFEAVAKSGHTVGYMSSFNRIGYWNSSTNYALHKLLVRGEWQFKGRSITDAWVKTYNPIDLMVRVGDEQPLGTGSAYPEYNITYGEWSAADNCVKVPANAAEKADGTNSLLSPTHYYAVRVAAQHILFSTVNSITMKNCLEIGQGEMYFGQYINGSQTVTIPGLDDADNLEIVSGSLPEGLSLEGGIITGAANTVGDYTVTVKGVTCNWIDFEADIVIHVVNTLEAKVNGEYIENADNNTVRVKSGEEFTLEFYSSYFVYGQQYSLGGGVPADVRIDETGFQTKARGSSTYGPFSAATFQIINLYQEFEDWSECEDTAAHSLYRGYIGAIPRNEDSTAGDMPTADVAGGNYYKAYEYSFSHSELPTGLEWSVTYQTVNGIAYGSYDVEQSCSISGVFTQAGTYTITVELLIPVGGVTAGWVGKLWFGGVGLMKITRTITIIVE